MAAIELHGLTKRFGDSPPSTASTSSSRPARSPASSAQRRRQDDDAAHAARPRGAHVGHGHLRRSPLRRPRAPGPPGGRRARGVELPSGPAGLDHLRILASATGLPAGRADAALAQVGMAEHARRRVGGFSLGMRQRLGLAAALLGEPSVLVLDEPANGLDPEGVHWLRDFLRPRPTAGRTVVVSSHVLAEVAQTVDHVVIIDRGRLVISAPLAELTARAGRRGRRAHARRRPVLGRARARDIDATAAGDVVTATGTTPEAVGAVIGALGLVVHEMRLERQNLEDVFFSLTANQGAPS